MPSSQAPRADVYSRVTAKIVADGVRPWMKPWSADHAAGRITRPKGVNVLMLWGEAFDRGYACPTWMTYKQASELGGQVRKGEHGSLVVYADRIRRSETDDKGKETEREIPFMKGYTVFNCEQVDGLPAHFYSKPAAPLPAIERIASADRFFAATGIELRHGGARAYYCEASDHVQMPPFESFRDAESYAATLAHEATHWTKHPKRLAREFGRKRWGDAGYAAEELVAELGAAFLCAALGITPEVREDHAAYIASWFEVLKHDNRAVFTAAAHAQRAADYLHGLQPHANKHQAADSDEAGHAFQIEAGHLFRSEAGRGSDLMSATRRLLPRIEAMMFRRGAEVKRAWVLGLRGRRRMVGLGGGG